MIQLFGILALSLASLTAQAGHRGYDRFEFHLEKLDKMLHEPRDTEEAIEYLVKNDVRRQLFKLEGLARLNKIQYEEFDQIYNKFKKFEDVLGKYTESKEYLDFAVKLGAPAAATKKLKAVLVESKSALSALLEKSWLPDAQGVSGAEDMMQELYDFDWDSDSVDRKLMIQSYVRDIKKVIENEYDMDKLQDGIHELRRRLRWFPIYLLSLDGLVSLKKPTDEAQLPEWESLIKKMGWSGEEKAFATVSVDRYLTISDMVAELGELKDQGEYVGALLSAMGGTAESKKWILNRMKELGIPVRDVHAQAHSIYKELKRDQVLEGLVKELTSSASSR